MTYSDSYLTIESRVLDAVADGCRISFAVALRVGIDWKQADNIINDLVRRGLLSRVVRRDFFGTWYEYEERLP